MITFTNEQLLVAAGLGAALLWYLYDQHGERFNITSDKNLAYSGVNSVGQAVSGDEHWNLGGWLYEVDEKYHPYAMGERLRDWIGEKFEGVDG
jgi:hypothetical protein